MRWNTRQYKECVDTMREKGYSVKEIALACGVTPQSIRNVINMDEEEYRQRVLQDEIEKAYIDTTVPLVNEYIEQGFDKNDIIELIGLPYKELHRIVVLMRKQEVKNLVYIINPLADKIRDMRVKGTSVMNIHNEIGISYKRVKEIMELEGIL